MKKLNDTSQLNTRNATTEAPLLNNSNSSPVSMSFIATTQSDGKHLRQDSEKDAQQYFAPMATTQEKLSRRQLVQQKLKRRMSSPISQSQSVAITENNKLPDSGAGDLLSVAQTTGKWSDLKMEKAANNLKNEPINGIVQPDIQQFLVQANEAIEKDIQPERIVQGSSGSYFVRNTEGRRIAVFKPKNEEPYGQLNPKWTKWLHKTLLPCCFGRSCLIPNLGYISEAAASTVDQHLKFNIVPRTVVANLSSPSFFYRHNDTKLANNAKGALPPKIGSFQVFMHGYQDASKFLKEATMLKNGQLTKTIQVDFQRQFEKLVIIDFLIRNTDRGLDNWMVKVNSPSQDELKMEHPTSVVDQSNEVPSIQIAGIDNGLAFPFKHPDQWRSYPYGWASLPLARYPFTNHTRQQVLPMITSTVWWEDLVKDLRRDFSMDTDFDEKQFKRQISVMRGQLYNLIRTLKSDGEGPLDLVQKVDMTIFEDENEWNVVGRNASGVQRWEPDFMVDEQDPSIPSKQDNSSKNKRPRPQLRQSAAGKFVHALDVFKGKFIAFRSRRPWFTIC